MQDSARQQHRSADCEAARGEEGVGTAAAALGGKEKLCLAGKVPEALTGL